MVKTLLLGLLAATICGFVNASPIAADLRNPQKLTPRQDLEDPDPETEALPLDDPAARSERSTNLSHVTGTARKLSMFIKNRNLQILPDGTVNGTTDDTSAYSILQRTTVGIGQMKIQGVATCQYLCMAKCGLLYGSREFGDECVFNETIEHSHYNTYSSSKYSNANRTFYLALNQRGQSRKVVLRARKHLGRLASYILVMTRPVSAELHPMRHHAHPCPAPAAHQTPKVHPHQQLCPKKRKRKKKKRKCTSVENESESCQKRHNVPKHKAQNRNNHKCVDDKTSEMCQRDLNIKKKNKFNNSDKLLVSDPKKKRRNKKGVKKRLNQFESETTTTTTAPTSTTLEYTTPDEDYGVDLSTHADWEDSTAMLDVHMAVSDAMHTVPTLVDSD